VLSPGYRDRVLINEARSEWKGSIAAWVGLVVVTFFLATEFAARAERVPFLLWLVAMSICLAAWLAAWVSFKRAPPTDESVMTRWIPRARWGMHACNAVAAASVWVFLPAADPELRALLLVLYAWYLVVQFAAATEATQVLGPAVAMVLGSLTLWLLIEQPPHFVKLALFLPLFGATLLSIRRFVREAVVAASSAHAAAEDARNAMKIALADLERERDAKTHFIRAASHDLQQPLQAAGLFLNRIKASARAPGQAAALADVKRSLGLARSLVDSMLQTLRLEGGSIGVNPAAFTAGDLFDRLRLTQGLSAAAEQVQLSFVGRRILLHTDFELLARAVENLVSNALRHAGARRVLVGARSSSGIITIWVVDDGRGIEPQEAARIFSPFEQGRHVGPSGGFGLGLASVEGIAALLGGACGLRPGLMRGSAFYIQLPPAPTVGKLECVA
jgi:signal transduction histidine kinase